MKNIESIARIICEDGKCNPDDLEPGDLPKIDGTCPNGDPGHYLWRHFVPLAEKISISLHSRKVV